MCAPRDLKSPKLKKNGPPTTTAVPKPGLGFVTEDQGLVRLQTHRAAQPASRLPRTPPTRTYAVTRDTASIVPPYNVLITGSTKGIGLALAEKFLSTGDNVFVCSRNESNVNAVVSELTVKHGKGRVFGCVCNVSRSADVEALVKQAQFDLGDIDIWINNAGSNAYSYKPLIETAESDLVDIVDTNVLGVMLCCQAAIKSMRRQKAGGHVFNMDGAGADGNPTPRFAAYGATKRALAQLSKSVQAELKTAGIDSIGLHNLSPGMVTTELLMSGSDTSQAKFFINCLAETPDVVAEYLVPRIREVPEKKSMGGTSATGMYIKFLTPVKAYSAIFSRLLMGKNKNRFVTEE